MKKRKRRLPKKTMRTRIETLLAATRENLLVSVRSWDVATIMM